jgi:hypothetical protein
MQINLATCLSRDEIISLFSSNNLKFTDYCLLTNHDFTYVFFRDHQHEEILKSAESALWEAFDWSEVEKKDYTITGNPKLLPFYKSNFIKPY